MSMLKVLTRFSRRFAPRGMPAFFAALFAFALLAPPEAEAQWYQGAAFSPRDYSWQVGKDLGRATGRPPFVRGTVVLVNGCWGAAALQSALPPGISFVPYALGNRATNGGYSFAGTPTEPGEWKLRVRINCPPHRSRDARWSNGGVTNEVTATVAPAVGAPSRPRAPDSLDVAVASATGGVTVKWKAPSDAGSGGSIKNYFVRHRVKAGPGAWQPSAAGTELAGSATTHSIAGLSGDTEYEVEVRAKGNDDKLGHWFAAGSAAPLTPRAAFAETALRATEGGGALSFTLNLPVAAHAAVEATITPGNITASDADYAPAPLVLAFAAGEDSAGGNISITDDNLVEPDETFRLSITALDGFDIGDPAVVTIADDDRAAARVAFHASDATVTADYTANVAEDVSGGVVTIPVTISPQPTEDVVLQIEAAPGGDADEGADWTLTTTTLTFPANNATLTRNVSVAIINDDLFEAEETIRLRIRAADADGSDSTDANYDHADLYARGGEAIVTIASEDAREASAPQNARLTPQLGGLRVSWEAPQFSRVANPNYRWRVRWREAVESGPENPWQNAGGDAETGELLTDAAAREYDIAGLADGGEYDVQVAAVTSLGLGLWSAAQSATTIDASLRELSLTGADGKTIALSPAFSAGVYTYTAAEVATPAYFATVSAATNDAAASYSVNGAAPPAALTVRLATGANTINVAVTAAGGGGSRVYTVTFSRAEGRAGPPQNARLTPELGRIRVAWETPQYGGVANPNYRWRVRWREAVDSGAENAWQGANGDAQNGELLTDAAARAYVITGLADGAEYDVQVAAVTRLGVGLWSDEQSATSLDASLSALSLTGADGKTIALSPAFSPSVYTYTAAEVAVAAYFATVAATTNDNAASFSVNGMKNPPINIRLSTGENTIKITVVAADNSNSRAYSVTFSRATGQAAAPANLQLVSQLGRIVASWQAPPYAGGSEILRYRIRWREAVESGPVNNWQGAAGDAVNGEILFDPLARRYAIENLTSGTAYEVQVAVATASQLGAWSPSQRAIPGTTPNAPPSLRAAHGGGQVTLTWRAPPAAAGAEVSGYRARWRCGDEIAWNNGGRGVDAGSGTSFTVTGLANDVACEFQVFAVSAIGDGPPSPSARATPRGGTRFSSVVIADANNLQREFPLDPPFSPSQNNYTVRLPNSVSQVRATMTRTNSGLIQAQDFLSTGSRRFTSTSGSRHVHTTQTIPAGAALRSRMILSIFDGATKRAEIEIFLVRATGNPLGAPGAPRVAAASDAAGGLSIAWDALSGADSYRMRWRRQAEPGSGAGAWQPGENGETAASPKMLRNLIAGAYDVQIAGFNAAGLGAWSPAASAEAAVPTITLTPQAASKVYGAADPAISYTAALADGDTAAQVFSSVPLVRAPGETAGEYAYRAKEPLPLETAFRAKYAHYSVVVAGAAAFTISRKPLDYASTTADKVYDGATTPPADLGGAFSGAVSATVNGVAIDDTIAGRLFIGGGAYADAAVGDDKTLSGFTLAGAAAANYQLRADVRGDIRRRAVTYADTADARAYDGGVTVSGALDDGVWTPPLVSGDQVGVDASGARFEDADVGAAKAVTGLSASGAAAGNYDITFAVSGDITPREAVVGAVVLHKVYDGGNSLAGAEVASGSVTGAGSESLQLRLKSDASGAYASVNAAGGIALSGIDGGDFELAASGGAKASNYRLPSAITASGTIAKRPLHVRANNLSDDAPPTAGLGDLSRVTVLSGVAGTGLVAPDTAAQVLQGAIAFGARVADGDTAPIQRGTLAVKSGLPGDNYELVFIEGVFTYLDPNRATLVLTPTTTTRVYGAPEPGEFAYTVAPQAGSNFAAGHSAATMFFTTNPVVRADAANNNAGAYDFLLAASPQYAAGIRATYNFLIADGAQYTITPKPLHFTATAGTAKEYDGGAAASEDFAGNFGSGLVSGDEVDVEISPGGYDSKNVAEASVINVALAGAKAGNYDLQTASVSASITPRPVRVSAVTLTKTYDGTTAPSETAVRGGGAVSDTVLGESFTLRVSITAYESAAVGAGIGVSGASFSLVAGNAASLPGNYKLPADIAITGAITKLATTYTDSVSRVYDAGRDLGVELGGDFAPPLAGGDTVVINPVGATFGDANAGAGKKVGGLSAEGSELGNYEVQIDVSGEITRRPLNVTAAGTGEIAPADLSTLLEIGEGDGHGFAGDDTAAQVLQGASRWERALRRPAPARRR